MFCGSKSLACLLTWEPLSHQEGICHHLYLLPEPLRPETVETLWGLCTVPSRIDCVPLPGTSEGPALFWFWFLFLLIYLWLCWVFISVRGLSLVAASGGHSSSRCAGLSLSRPLLLRSTGSRRVGSVVVAHGPSRSAACGIFPDQGSNPCPLHWQADSQPLRHQGSPPLCFCDTWTPITITRRNTSAENTATLPAAGSSGSQAWLRHIKC